MLKVFYNKFFFKKYVLDVDLYKKNKKLKYFLLFDNKVIKTKSIFNINSFLNYRYSQLVIYGFNFSINQLQFFYKELDLQTNLVFIFYTFFFLFFSFFYKILNKFYNIFYCFKVK